MEYLIRQKKRQIIYLERSVSFQIRSNNSKFLLNTLSNPESVLKMVRKSWKRSYTADYISILSFASWKMPPLFQARFSMTSYRNSRNMAICCVSGTQFSTLLYPKWLLLNNRCDLWRKKSVELMLENWIFLMQKNKRSFWKQRKLPDNQLIINWIKIVNIRQLGN